DVAPERAELVGFGEAQRGQDPPQQVAHVEGGVSLMYREAGSLSNRGRRARTARAKGASPVMPLPLIVLPFLVPLAAGGAAGTAAGGGGGPARVQRFLALGDSYTIGEGVEPGERWPVRLAAGLRARGLEVAEP